MQKPTSCIAARDTLEPNTSITKVYIKEEYGKVPCKLCPVKASTRLSQRGPYDGTGLQAALFAVPDH